MNTAKKIVIISCIIILVLFVLVGFLLLPRKKTTPSPIVLSPTPIPMYLVMPTLDPNILKTDKLTISNVAVNNFYRFLKDRNSNGDILIDENSNYHIVYFEEFNRFLISILSTPFLEGRVIAENAFLDLLGIDKISACKLSVEIATPYDINPDESATSHPLSFCQ